MLIPKISIHFHSLRFFHFVIFVFLHFEKQKTFQLLPQQHFVFFETNFSISLSHSTSLSLSFSLSLSHANATYCAAAAVMRPRSAAQLRALFFALSLTLSLFAIEIPLQLQGKTHFDDTRFTTKILACLQLSCSNNNNSKAKTATTSTSKHRLSWLSDTAASFKPANRARRNSAKEERGTTRARTRSA